VSECLGALFTPGRRFDDEVQSGRARGDDVWSEHGPQLGDGRTPNVCTDSCSFTEECDGRTKLVRVSAENGNYAIPRIRVL
jgi:hypothetical protein